MITVIISIIYPTAFLLSPTQHARHDRHTTPHVTYVCAQAPLKKMAFGDICSYGPKKGNISLTHGSLVDPIVDNFQTDESFEIADVIKSYQTASKSVAITVRKALF